MGSLPGNKDGAVSMDTHESSGSDTTDQRPDSATSKADTSCNNTIVTGSANSTVTDSTVIGAIYNSTINHGEKQREGLSCNITEGAQPKLKISVPAEDGGTLIHVHCANAEVRHWSYCRHVDIENTFGSTWTFGNIFDGFMAAIINGKIGDDFFDLIGKWMERYGCKLHKVYKKCLVIEFVHETEEGRNKMIQEQDTVRQMFQNFMESVKSDAPVCTLEVKKTETPTSSGKPDTASECTDEDVSLPSTSSREEARSPGIEDEKMSEVEYPYHAQATEDVDTDEEIWPMRYMQFSGPVSLSRVDLHRCENCWAVRRDCQDDLSTFKNIFVIHWDRYLTSVYEKIIKLRLSKILTAFRNSHGGVLIVHAFNTFQSGDFDKFINQVFGSVVNQDVVPCEVFKTQKIKNDMFRIDVEPSDMFVTLDYKTKLPSLSMDKFENASNEKVRHLLFSSRTTESTDAALRGVSTEQENIEALRLHCRKGYTVPPLEHMLLHSLESDMTGLSVPEHISALSKKKSGGTIYVVMSELKFDAIPLGLQKSIKDQLMQALKKRLLLHENKHSKVSLENFRVFDIALSKYAETGECIIEIAVGHVNGCVFYDPEGPESYKVEEDRCVRLPFEKWIEEAFE